MTKKQKNPERRLNIIHNDFKELTRAEEEVMNIIWKDGGCFVHEVIARMSEPKPAYTTVSTVCRILVSKGFLSYKLQSPSHQYLPAISREIYTDKMMGNVMQNYFDNSFKQLVSFFAERKKVSEQEREEIIALLSQTLDKE
ncbi:MAG: BlaI/MecI/CopY family transcriptional regulator [Bacteroidales bacterium]|nr:BlaI/MecI/CopY family transcriptional regulator [Bacteroidales bacterium]MCL2739361.1 BlaI/MecI/CopY family transcriptional regulator [Bacteroidales bacterium]